MIRHTDKYQKGFTLVELTLALAFVGFLLIFIVSTTVEVVGDYSKGITVKEINQSAEAILAGVSTVAGSTTAGTIDISALGSYRLCFNSVSYVWNVQGGNLNKYTNGNVITLARVSDVGGAMCVKVGGVYPSPIAANSTELITGPIWVQSINADLTADQKLIDLSLNLSTSGNYTPTIPTSSGLACPGGSVGRFCATASFNTSVNASNIGG